LFYKTQSGQHDGLLSASIDWFEPNDRTASDKGNSTVSGGVGYALKSEEISGSAFALRHRIQNIQFNNTTELNSTIYFCRVNHNDYNYSSNPTYLSQSEIRVKQQATDTPVSYITTIGLYNEYNELLAVGKLSKPLKKSFDREVLIRLKLDY